MSPTPDPPAGLAFGRFRVLSHRRELLADGQPLKLGGRAYDVLMTLIEAHGAVVSRDALMARVWPERVVEENALEVQISTLRAAFGPDRDLIRTVSGRGYQFTSEIGLLLAGEGERVDGGEVAAKLRSALPPTNLPERVSEFIGRDGEVRELLSLVASHRLVTLTGPGGIGKTRLALAVARELRAGLADGVWVAEFSPLADPSLVPATVAAAVGLQLGAGEVSARRVAQVLAGRRLLLVLDTCEHVADAAAELAEAVLYAGSAICVIATGREPLRAEGEQIYAVQPLAVPPGEGEDLWQYGAVQLFAARSRGTGVNVPHDHRVASAIAAICRQLDGIPLAIELAAGRAATLGITELAARLEDRFNLLTGGRRTALPRHQTLRAALDWSFELLSDPERVILRLLAIFPRAFSLDAAVAVASSAQNTALDVVGGVANLVAKSLVVADVSGTKPRFRLLDTTRAYAIEKLDESGEREQIARRHAEHYRNLFERAEREVPARPAHEWLADHALEIDNLRAALDWAFSLRRDGSMTVALTAAAVPLWLRLSLLDECRSRAKQALGAIGAGGIWDPRNEMRLSAALGASSSEALEMGAAFTKALEIAENLGDVSYQLRALQGLQFYHATNRRYRTALPFAQKFHDLAILGSDPSVRLAGDCMIGAIKHTLGDQISARLHLEQVATYYSAKDHGRKTIRLQDFFRFGIEVQISARVFLARVLWLQGFSDQALRAAEMSLGEATGHDYSVCYALAFAACPIALWVGNLAAAAHYAEMLLSHSRRHGSSLWAASGSRFHKIVALKGGALETESQVPHSSPDEIAKPSSSFQLLSGLTELAEALAHTGRTAKGLVLLEAEIERSETTWLTPELLRLKGEFLLMQNAPSAAETAKALFQQAQDEARRQGALSWELRAAMSLARSLRNQGHSDDAVAVLQPVYNRFTEGFGTTDLVAAKQLLNQLGTPDHD